MISAELTFLDHCVAASDALKEAAVGAALSYPTYGLVTDLRHAGELLFQAAFAIVDAGNEHDAAALEPYRWALMKMTEVASAMPGDGVALLAKWATAAEKAQTRAVKNDPTA